MSLRSCDGCTAVAVCFWRGVSLLERAELSLVSRSVVYRQGVLLDNKTV